MSWDGERDGAMHIAFLSDQNEGRIAHEEHDCCHNCPPFVSVPIQLSKLDSLELHSLVPRQTAAGGFWQADTYLT
jgi:hypothetical protein